VFLLGTNIVSLLDARRHGLHPGLVPRLRRNGPYIYLSVITSTELEAGILKLRRDTKIKRANEFAALRDRIMGDFADRILPVSANVALEAARLADIARPQHIELADLIVAATAKTHGLCVLTRNLRHFVPTGVTTIDPTTALPADAAP
jgi:predicted nucleic acid-binding protein